MFSKGSEKTFKLRNYHSGAMFGFVGPVRKITAADKSSDIVHTMLQLSPVSCCKVLYVASVLGRRAAAQLSQVQITREAPKARKHWRVHLGAAGPPP